MQYASILSLVVMFGLMYVILILPQRRREKKTKEMLNAMKVGENVTTIGGVMGKVINIKDDEVTIESGVEKTQLKVKRWAIKEIEKLIES
jgi:preprotein translocase subunit YajC